MTSPTKYEFIQRTQEILISSHDFFLGQGREVTFLLNCLLGLIITVLEMGNKEKGNVFASKIDAAFLTFVPNEVGFVEETKRIKSSEDENKFYDRMDISLTPPDVTELNELLKVLHKADLLQKDKSWFINKIRNGIAHQNIKPIPPEGDWEKIKLWNINPEHRKDFEIIFTIDELKKFAIYVSSEYLNWKEINATAHDK